MFRRIRIFILLFILLAVAVNTWRAQRQAVEWKAPLHVVIYPINGDRSERVTRYLATIQDSVFDEIEDFIEFQASTYHVYTSWGQPVTIALAPEVDAIPPAPPREHSMLSVVCWSLRLRYWAWRHDSYAGPSPQVRLFVQYFDPATPQALPHSLGLQKGMIGVVNVFAARHMAGSNNVVIAHELLHTLGASDKYAPATNLPRFPDGYAEPQRHPLHPQEKAEIMGGRIPHSESRASIPESLGQVVVGAATAREINWLR